LTTTLGPLPPGKLRSNVAAAGALSRNTISTTAPVFPSSRILLIAL
jgi:hypothetical protein